MWEERDMITYGQHMLEIKIYPWYLYFALLQRFDQELCL